MILAFKSLSRGEKIFLHAILYQILLFYPFAFLHTFLAVGLSSGILLLCFLRFFFEREFVEKKKLMRFFKISHKVLSLSCVALLLFDHQQLRGLEPGMSLLSVLAPLKLVEARRPRDYAVFLMIAMLLFLSQLLSLNALWVVLYVLAVCLYLFYLLTLISWWNESTNESAGKTKFGKFELKRVLWLFVLAAPLTMSLFVFFPRVSIGNVFLGHSPDVGITGFTERLRPGEVSEIVNSAESVFRVIANNDEQEFPSFRDLYWRGRVLTKARGLSWDAGDTREGSSSRSSRRRYRIDRKDGRGQTFSYRVSMAQQELSPVFHLDQTFSFRALSAGQLQEREGETYEFRPFNNQRANFDLVRDIEGPIIQDPPGPEHLQYPDKMSEEGELYEFKRELEARALDKGLELEHDIPELVEIVLTHFREEEFYYTLSPGEYGGENGLEEFLFARKRGFCEHYAAATGIILRLLNIPSRVVVGFQGGNYNDLGDYYLVSSRDAHAWVEYWNEREHRWVRIDPTSYIAPSRIERGAEYFLLSQGRDQAEADEYFQRLEISFLRRLGYRIDSYYFLLNQRFLGHNLESQMRMLRSLGLDFRSQSQAVWVALLALATLIVVIPIAVLIYWCYRKVMVQRRTLEEELGEAYRVCLNRLGQKAPERLFLSSSMTPLQIVEKTSQHITNHQQLKSLIQAFVDLRYAKGPNSSSRPDDNEIKRLISQLRRFRPIFR